MTAPEIPLPRRPEPPRPYSFPLVATIAPVVGALSVWAITRSPFALIFAVLGPVVAVGSLIDSRVQRRRTARRERARFGRDVELTAQRVASAKRSLSDELRARRQSGPELAAAPAGDPERWRYRDGPLPLRLGLGAQKSGLRLTGDTAQSSFTPDELVDGAFARLRADAALLDGAPVAVDARLGVAVSGRGAAALAFTRSLVVQLAAALSPAEWGVRLPESAESWLEGLPHPRAGRADGQRIEFVRLTPRAGREEEKSFVIALGVSLAQLPWDCRVCVSVVGAQAELVRHPESGGDEHGEPAGARLRVELVSQRLAEACAGRLREAAVAEGLGGAAEPPGSVALARLWHGCAPTPGLLPAAFLADSDGAFALDIVRDGPHAVIGGTTGSGKSELLISWVLALARNHSPHEFSCLLIDFKGGASFAALEGLPHCVGLMTDLDPSAARRALESLRAELRHRERRLADAGVRAIDELTPGAEPLPRLVVIVDEFAAMIGDFADLHALFADIAARGRSLGVHLVLCTQRPAGVLRDSVMANCTLRISLRVNNAADSSAVIGTPDAAALPARPLGRAIVSVAGGRPRRVQVAVAGPGDAAEVSDAWAGSPRPRRPWLPPLPELLSPGDVAGSPHGFAFGLSDVPEEQAQPAAEWVPSRHGNLLIVGGAASGKTSALAAIDAASAGTSLVLPSTVEGAWDVLERLSDGSDTEQLLLIDDIDALIARFDERWRSTVIERLGGLLRDGGTHGPRLALSVRRISPQLQPLAALCDSHLILRLPSRQEHVLSGGDGAHYNPELPPGGAHWQGHAARIAWVPPHERRNATERPTRRLLGGTLDELSATHLIVTNRPAAYGPAAVSAAYSPAAVSAARPTGQAVIDAAGARQTVADPAAWQARWAEFGALRRTHPVIFDRCTLTELRALAGVTTLPPVLGRRAGGAWLLACDGTLERVQLPEGG